MRRSCFVLAAMFVTCVATAASAQTEPLSPLQLAIACAPPPSNDGPPPEALRIIGAQDAMPRELFSDRDLLVIDGGASAGVELGHQFFVRRTITFGDKHVTRGAKTLGWVRVVAVNDSTAIALVDHVCGGIVVGDYLEPFAAPVVSAAFEKDETTGEPDFSNLGHVVVGSEDRMAVGAGDFVLLDWGEAQGLSAGVRVAIYRDLGADRLPLTSVGEGVVVSTSSTMALARLTRARDAIYGGDYIAVRK